MSLFDKMQCFRDNFGNTFEPCDVKNPKRSKLTKTLCRLHQFINFIEIPSSCLNNVRNHFSAKLSTNVSMKNKIFKKAASNYFNL